MSMTHDEMIAVIQAHKEGKVVQGRLPGGEWTVLETPGFNFGKGEYRIAPVTPGQDAARRILGLRELMGYASADSSAVVSLFQKDDATKLYVITVDVNGTRYVCLGNTFEEVLDKAIAGEFE